MIKTSSIRRISIATLALFLLLIIYFFPTKIETKNTLSYIKRNEMPIFLVDNMNYVARTSIIKNSKDLESQIYEILETLTENSKKSNYIRDGFKPLIPKNTKVLDISIDEDTLTINFSKELLNVKLEDEEKMLETIIYSITEIKEIKKIIILVEKEKLEELPKSHKKLPKVLDKEYGINKLYTINSLKNTSKTTIYYLSKHKDYYYYVPVTKVSNDNEKIKIIINELKTTPIYHTNLISYLLTSTNLSNYEILENSINLSFDNYLIANMKEENILEEVKYSIALSLRDTYNINEVIFNIQNEKPDKISIR